MRSIKVTYKVGAQDSMGSLRAAYEWWSCNHCGRGLFYLRHNEWIQLIGTCDTPRFTSPKQLRAYIRRCFGVLGGRITETDGW